MHDGLTDTHPLDIGLALIFGKPIKNRQRERVREGGRERQREREREGGREGERDNIYLSACLCI